jgi:uncharacterized protein
MPNATPSIEQMTRRVAERWFSALKAGDTQSALACLADAVTWINSPPDRGLSDIIPWLGEFHGREAVAGTFVTWGQLSEIHEFELRSLTINSDEAFAVVHEVALIKSTGLFYDIEFIQRLRISDERIVMWKSYWDTSKGIAAFRGDLHARLIVAAKTGDFEEAMRVLPFGGDANAVDLDGGQPVLMLAAARGHLEMVKKLLEYGANPNGPDLRAGTVPLHKACQGGHLEIVEALIAAGAFIDFQAATTGHTPLVEAIWYKRDRIVEYLLSANARLGLITSYGFTLDQHLAFALKVNAGRSGHDALLRIEQLVNARKESDATRVRNGVLNQAVLDRDLAAVKAALEAGQDREQRYPMLSGFSDGHTPLLIAARDGETEIVQAGVDVNATDPIFGAVPLHKATYNGWSEVNKILAAAPGVNLNYQGPANGYTPLHDALWHGYPDCAQTLLDAGARVDIVAYDGKLPLDIALEELGPGAAIVTELRDRALAPPASKT